MTTLLQIDSSPSGDASISRRLTDSFVKSWQATRSDGKVLTRDLTRMDIPPVTAAWIATRFSPEESYSAEQRDILALSDALIDELRAADEYVFGVPMYNFGIPAVLKLWIDQIARPRKTFSYIGGKPEGLLKGKKATFLVASGGAYDAGTVMASFNFVEPYLRTLFGFLGVTDTTFIHAGGTGALASGSVDRESYLQPHVESIQRRLSAA